MNIAIKNIFNKFKIEDSDSKSKFNKYKKILNYIGKVISSAIIVLLVLIGAFLVYYVVAAQKYKNDPTQKPAINMYTIISGSMEPTIHVYDVVFDIAPKSPQDIKVGDVITFTSTSSISQGLLVTHRVQDIRIVNGKYEYVTKGDYNPTADSSTAKYEDIIGKVAFKIPQLGRVQFFVSSKAGWFFVVLLPAMGVIVYDVMKLIKLLSTKNVSDKVESKMSKSSGDIKIDNIRSVLKKKDYQDNFNKLKELHSGSEVVLEDNINRDDYLKRLNDLKNKNNTKQFWYYFFVKLCKVSCY